MTNYFRLIGFTLLAVTIIHGHATGRWHELHILGFMLASISLGSTGTH